jgi:hypothetical protein
MLFHSIKELLNRGFNMGRWETIASHTIKNKNSTPITEIIDPIDEIMFHEKKVSG